MDKSSNDARGSTEASRPQPTLSRESTATIAPTTDFSQLSRKASHTSTVSSIGPSPLASRETSPSRTRQNNSRPSNNGTWSRRNSQQDLRQQDPSPTRISKTNTAPVPPVAKKALSSSNVPSLPPVVPDITIKAPVPDKSPSPTKWPVSPRLKSPPPNLSKPDIPPPLVNVPTGQPPQPSGSEPPSQPDTESEEVVMPAGMRTPRTVGLAASTLETVEEVSPFSSPKGSPEGEEALEDTMISETSSQQDVLEITASKSPVEKPNLTVTEATGENSGAAGRRSGSVAPPPLLSRQSSTSTKLNAKGKGEVGLQSMTVETETVVSIPQVALAPPGGAPGTNGSLRTKPSSETIRPKKEKKRQTRRPPSVNAGTGEPPRSSVTRPGLRLRHHRSTREMSSAVEACPVSPTKSCCYEDANGSRPHSPAIRSQSLVFPPVSSLLTKHRPASSKADVFEAKVASAVEEANSSDSEETFVYDSNPPDRDRPQRFHSRTPSTTSMASQVDRGGMRSIHSVMEGPAAPAVKKNMKFVNSISSYNGNDGAAAEDDGKGTGRSHIGSARGTARQHHQFNRFGRNVGNGHASIFADESPFAAPLRSFAVNPRHSPGLTSPRAHNLSSRVAGKRNLGGVYDLEDTTGAEDERSPLIHSSVRSARSGRNRRYGANMRNMEQQSYRSQPTILNRFANCLVLTVMLLLVVTGAIGFMFATSQPLQNIELVSMKNVVASEQELMLDLTVRAKNPNVVVVVVDSADIEVFAKSPYAGTDSEWWRRPHRHGMFQVRRRRVSAEDDPTDDKNPNMRLGAITEFDSPLSFEGTFFREGLSTSTAGVRLIRPGNSTDGGSERWERILRDEFDLIVKGVLRYTLPLSQNVRSASISGRTTVKPNSANDPLKPNGTEVSTSWRR